MGLVTVTVRGKPLDVCVCDLPRCDYRWLPQQGESLPVMCARCRSRRWNSGVVEVIKEKQVKKEAKS